jgi:hypothetical protein
MRALAVILLVPALACTKRDNDHMPAATEWNSGDPGIGAIEMPNRPQGVPSNDPHAGMMGGGGGGDPHAGMMGGTAEADPHAGVPGAPPLAGNFGGDPNAAHQGAGVDVSQLGFQSPDPNRPVDPNRRIRGTVKISAAVAPRAQPGSVLYLMVRKPAPEGQQGTLIAVDKLTWKPEGLAFELTERHAMVVGAPDMIGELMLTARIDADEDAGTRQPGDVIGQTKVTIPADGVTVTLDGVIP